MKLSLRKTFSVSMFWNKRDMNFKTKEATISLTVNLQRQQFRVSLKISSTKADFDKALSTARNLTDIQKELKQAMNDYILKAETILDRLQEPSKESFVRLFKLETDLFQSNKTEVNFFYQMKQDEAVMEGRIGTSKYFQYGKRCLAIYAPKICFEDIDERWLKSYQMYMKGLGNSDASISIKMRCLRQIFNVARVMGFIPSLLHPFKTFKVPSSTKSKSVLYPAQLKALYDYVPVGIVEKRAKDYFFFCYLANGMNFKDMACLKWKDIHNDSFTFIREKTKFSCRNGVKEIRVHLHEDLKRIIDDYGNKSKKPDSFVFPVLNCKTDLLRQHSDRTRHKRVCNKKLALIGKSLGFDVHLCLNLARHSFATTLKLSGTPVAFIGDALGHTNSKTTEHYMKTLPDENVRQMSAQLLKFG